MFGKSSWKNWLPAAVILAVAAGQSCIAQSTCTLYTDVPSNPGGVSGGGIFVQPGAYHHMTLTVVNLTSAQLTDLWTPPPPLPNTWPVPFWVGATHGTPPFDEVAGGKIDVDPLRSSIWAGAQNDWDAAHASYYRPRYQGMIPFVLKDSVGNVRAQFAVDFAMQNDGTWISLSRWGWTGWCSPGAPSADCGGVYRTEWMHQLGDMTHLTSTSTDSLRMHNVMTLANAYYVVALYAAINEHLVLVVREVQDDDYSGFNLDFVDHKSDVPGACNQY